MSGSTGRRSERGSGGPRGDLDSGRALVIVNPASGQHSVERSIRRIGRALEQAGWTFDVRRTEPEHDADALAREGVARGGYDLVVVAGGDGTVMGTIQGLWQAGDGRTAALPVAIAPLGTGNGLAATMGVQGDPESAVSAALAGELRTIDLGRFVGASGADRVFAVFAGAGLDAAVMMRADRGAKDRLGPFAYLVEAVRESFAERRRHVRLTLDDETHELDAHTVMAFNASGRVLAGLPLGPETDPADGLLEVIVLDEEPGFASLGELFELAAIGDRTGRLEHAYRARRVRIDADPPLPVHADGDPVGETPIELEVEPGALRIWTPKRE